MRIYSEESRLSKYLTIWAILTTLFVTMEVLFNISKISFLSRLSALEDLMIWINTMVLMFLVGAMVLSLLLFLRKVFFRGLRFFVDFVIYIFFAILLLSFIIVQLDTFSYSTFGEDMTSVVESALKAIRYIALFLLFVLAYYIKKHSFSKYRSFLIFFALLLVVFLVSSAVRARNLITLEEENHPIEKDAEELPNIILFSSDGLDINHLSVYGYQRKTTPRIEEFARESILFTRAYTNAGNTRGSITSILTGKHPLTTMVLYPPDILMGRDSFEHLPAILKRLGYCWIDIGDPIYTPPSLCNLVGGIDSENGTRLVSHPVLLFLKRLFNLELYLLRDMASRYIDRMSYFMGLSKKSYFMKKIIHGLESAYLTDEKRLKIAMAEIKKCREPFVLHMHMMKTHGPKFKQIKRIFSAGKKKIPDWDIDAYDDAIYTVDSYFGELLEFLKKEGLYENSLIIFHTDHGYKWGTSKPVPLIVHLPGQERAVKKDYPVQLMDIAPSILTLLDIPIPEWMEGEPVLFLNKNTPESSREIYTVEVKGEYIKKARRWLKPQVGPPYYGLYSIVLVKGDYVYKYFFKYGDGFLYHIRRGENFVKLDRVLSLSFTKTSHNPYNLPYRYYLDEISLKRSYQENIRRFLLRYNILIDAVHETDGVTLGG